MTTEQLKQIKGVYDGLNAGVSNPIIINTVYGYLPNKIDGAPMRAKIVAINRFMMLSYHDELQKASQSQKTDNGITESIGTIENKPKQSHTENSLVGDNQDIQGFLTKQQKEDLKAPIAGTTLEIQDSNGKKRRTRTKKA